MLHKKTQILLKKILFPKNILYLKRVCLLMPTAILFQKYYANIRRKKVRETLQATLLNPCVQSALAFFVLHIRVFFCKYLKNNVFA